MTGLCFSFFSVHQNAGSQEDAYTKMLKHLAFSYHGSTIQAVVNANSQSNGKGRLSTTHGSETAEQMSVKLRIYNYVGLSGYYDYPRKSRWHCDNVCGLTEHVTCHVISLWVYLFYFILCINKLILTIKQAKYSNFHIIKTTAVILTKFCKIKKTSRYSLWVVPKCVKLIQDGKWLPSWKNIFKNCYISATIWPILTGVQAVGLSNEMSQILIHHSLVTAQPILMKLET